MFSNPAKEVQHSIVTVIPGMRKARHVERNIAISDGNPLDAKLLETLRGHRWIRTTNIE